MRRALVFANLALLILFPLSWAAPLARAGVLPLFGLSEISVLSGIAALWHSDPVLAGIVALFALIAPVAKTLTLAAVLSRRAHPRWLRLTGGLGRLAMADVFLIALYIVLSKGIGVGRVETAWGLYLFTGCVLASLAISALAKRA
ncbi:paraquat-inducible membrane protein A [Pseudooceanicola sediminis]|uniref:Paraquat-inducible membrane protein A n=1 Tax=Pseudooceanicola sediminis TaxID=2211117 RepID=A0A399IZ18_9RHOB|nr:paraquat-inducible protein A [Pseudooceanicola sediminis]KAA2316141.1 paraquat-inducible protein A [Puniceibacterium sp. HSS470]RII38250.1 paraquat-inducible membrane protein A [Pseudooceanicola sediminis]|tara:strand:- start:5118 stop:5552 length:435 start_codon:yes stop_codon:yes gene_type:complete